MRLLFLVHGHQQFSVGGAENAAFSLFHECQNQPGIDAWMLAAVHPRRGMLNHGELRSMEGRPREYLLGTSCEWFRFSNQNILAVKSSLERLLTQIKPDIIHLHHFIHFGIDIIPLLQQLCPEASIVLTLHEYMALCMHNGQMVTTEQLKLCTKATPLACSLCFPERSTVDIFLRHHYIKTILQSCDALVSPSQFLINRFRDCGIDHTCFKMIENGLPHHFDSAACSDYFTSNSTELNRFAYFGQLNRFKGVLLLLQAASILQARGFHDFSINIYGANLDLQTQEFQDEFHQLHSKVNDRVVLRGSYQQSELQSLMMESDWVVVPSIWWENSPVVIQEAMFYGRPVIGSDIGGIMEKVSNRGGLSFTARSEAALADAIQSCCNNHDLHQHLRSQMQTPVTAERCLQSHLDLYQYICR